MNPIAPLIVTLVSCACAFAAVLSDFEDGTLQGWSADPTGGRDANGALTTSTERARSGVFSMMAVVGATTSSWDYAPYLDLPYCLGTAVTSSFWACYLGTGTGVRIWGEWRAADHSLLGSAGGAASYVSTSAWRKSSHITTGTWAAAAAFYRIQARMYAAVGDTACVDDIELGNAAATDPFISVTPDASFGVVVTNTSTNIVFAIANEGAASNLTVMTPLSLTGSAFSITAQPDTNTIGPGCSTSFTVVFSPASPGSHSGTITITNSSEQPVLLLELGGAGYAPVGYGPKVVAAWDFDDQNRIADGGAAANIGNAVMREPGFGGTYTFSAGPGSPFALSAQGWQDGVTAKHWQIAFDADSFAGLSVSSKQKSSDSGPRDFIVQYRIGASGDWTDVPGGGVTCTNDSASATTWRGSLVEVALPSACDFQPSVFLRWTPAGTNAVNGGGVTGAGTSRIDDIIVAAVPEPGLSAALAGLWLTAALFRRTR